MPYHDGMQLSELTNADNYMVHHTRHCNSALFTATVLEFQKASLLHVICPLQYHDINYSIMFQFFKYSYKFLMYSLK